MTKFDQTILAFDHGVRRIGVAIYRPHESAQPLATVDATLDVWNQIDYLVKKHKPNQLVVGRPRGMDGQFTAQTTDAVNFATDLNERTGIPVALQDETLTTDEARKRLPKDSSGKQQKLLLDQIAAQIILEDYLA